MFTLTIASLQLLLAASLSNTAYCDLSEPPVDAGETQAHGVILFIYPPSHTINNNYSGCQNQWFLDEDHFRKINVVHYRKGIITAYDSIKIDGNVAYHCLYENREITDNSDGRCPNFEKLKVESYRAGCFSKSQLDSSGSYRLAFEDCELK